jgi:hypothetical protein
MKRQETTNNLQSSENVYLVLDDFGALGRAYRETDEDGADQETLIRQLMEGQFNAPVRVIAFNLAAGWVRDVSADVALEIDCRIHRHSLEVCPKLARFVERQLELARRCKNPISATLPFSLASAPSPTSASKLVPSMP